MSRKSKLEKAKKANRRLQTKVYSALFAPAFFILYFFYVWLVINPQLYNQLREPVFFLSQRFLSDHLTYPGGLLEYISAFLSQSFYSAWIGALLITAIGWLIGFLTEKIIKFVDPAYHNPVMHYIPSVLILMMHSKYEYPLSVSVGILLFLFCAYAYIRLTLRHYVIRFTGYLVLSLILHYVTAGPFLLFGLICGFMEIVVQRRIVQGISYIFLAAIIPYLSVSYFFLLSLKSAFLDHLGFYREYKAGIIPYVLYSFFFLLFVWGIVKAYKKENIITFKMKYTALIQIIVFLLISGFFVIKRFDRFQKKTALVDYYAQRKMWPKVLETAQKNSLTNWLITYHSNRALYFTNRLLEDMFSTSQFFGTNGLVLRKDQGYYAPLQDSDLYFELGHINEAEHWATEALVIKGESPQILQRLALIHILKGWDDAARLFINKLEETLLFKKTAKRYRLLVGSPSLIMSDPQLNRIKPLTVQTDFISYDFAISRTLKKICEDDSLNKMSIEYLLAYHLLEKNLGRFENELIKHKNIYPHGLPKNAEEALLLIKYYKKDHKLDSFQLRKETVDKFQTFLKILKKHGGKKELAQNELHENYSDTYWYYALYNKANEAKNE